jgi:hypothetical protein
MKLKFLMLHFLNPIIKLKERTMNTHLNSILLISDMVTSKKVFKIVSEEVIGSVNSKELIDSLTQVSGAVRGYTPIVSTSTKVKDESKQLISSIRFMSGKIVSDKKNVFFKNSNNISLLNFLQKQTSENFHSDFIVALLDSKKSGDFALHFFKAILTFCGVKSDLGFAMPVSSQKEVYLHDLDQSLKGKEKGYRRIDIFANAGDFLLIIENKIKSHESENQTQDYHDACISFNQMLLKKKEIVEVLLSPHGDSPGCNSYISMTYLDLFEILSSLSNDLNPKGEFVFLDLYLNSLYEQYYRDDLNYFEFIKTYWSNK